MKEKSKRDNSDRKKLTNEQEKSDQKDMIMFVTVNNHRSRVQQFKVSRIVSKLLTFDYKLFLNFDEIEKKKEKRKTKQKLLNNVKFRLYSVFINKKR